MKRYTILAFLSVLIMVWSCSLNINEDPNNPIEADVKELLPSGQLTVIETISNLINAITSAAVQTRVSTRYENYNVDRTTVNGIWINQFYSGGLKDLEEVIYIGTQQENWQHVGIAKLMKAYTFSLMVDLWNDIPYTDAFDPDNEEIRYEKGAEIYSQLFALIDEGIADLDKTSSTTVSTEDLIYGGNLSHWKRMGKTLQLKMYNQIRLVDEAKAKAKIQELINEKSTFQSSQQDFEIKFSTSASPENRIPLYLDDYITRLDNRISTYFHTTLVSNSDPRIPYYIYNQTPGKFVGRTSGDPTNLATFEDQDTRSFHGLYPAGGKYDDGSGGITTSELGLKGAGVFRMMGNAMRLFIEAEAVMTLGVTGSLPPKELFEQGIREAMKKVNDLGVNPMSQETIDAYVEDRIAVYTRSSDDEKLRMIMMEKYVFQFGNGMEQYNDWRRTGIPDDLDLEFITNATLNRFPYPSSEKPPSLPANSDFVFWDK